MIAKRLVFHFSGYDATSPQAGYLRFVREKGRFETAWSVHSTASEPTVCQDFASWGIVTQGPNWRVETDYRLVRWDDVVGAAGKRSMWRRIPLGFIAFADFVVGGAFWGYLRTNWRYAAFFLYPIVLFSVLAGLAVLVGIVTSRASGVVATGPVVALLALALLLRWPGRRIHLAHLFDDWIFSHRYFRRGDAVLDARLDRAAETLVAAALKGQTDEIVVIGHSLGALLAVDFLDRVLRLDARFGLKAPRIALVTVGSSALKIGLHRDAVRFRASAARVAAARDVFWAEYQALTDVMNFYKTDPLVAMNLPATGRPVVRIVRIRDMLHPPRYRRIRRNFLRLHNQFVRANDRRAAYDYFMLICGPLSVERQIRSPDGAVSAIGEDGTCCCEPPKGESLSAST